MEYDEVARATSERGELVLRTRRDPDTPTAAAVLELRVNGVFVMDTQETTTERELAAATLALVEHPRAVVVGGLGLGFTLREVLADQRVEQVAVVEVEDELVRWMREGVVPHGPALLADERLRVVASDVRVAMAEASGATYDLVLLDVDNGPGYLVLDTNAEVYERPFLEQVHAVLRLGGAVAVWSSDEAPELAAVVAAVFGHVEPRRIEVELAPGGGVARPTAYWLYVGRR